MPNNNNQSPDKKTIPVAVKAIAGVAAVGCLTAIFTAQMLHKSANKPSDEPTSASSSVESEAPSYILDEPISSIPEAESQAESEAVSEESASSDAADSTATNTNSGSKSTSDKTSSGKTKTQQQQVVVEPRMKQKTETWADRPIPPDEHGYYGKLYAPDINTEESIFFGDEQKFLDAGWGQQTDTFLVGYDCAHLFWTDNEKCVQEMQWMYPGLRFQIETDSGIYVYEVETYANGHWAVNPDRRDVTEYRIYNNNREELGDIYTTYDVVYFAHEKDDSSVDVVEAHLVK